MFKSKIIIFLGSTQGLNWSHTPCEYKKAWYTPDTTMKVIVFEFNEKTSLNKL